MPSIHVWKEATVSMLGGKIAPQTIGWSHSFSSITNRCPSSYWTTSRIYPDRRKTKTGISAMPEDTADEPQSDQGQQAHHIETYLTNTQSGRRVDESKAANEGRCLSSPARLVGLAAANQIMDGPKRDQSRPACFTLDPAECANFERSSPK